MLHGLYLESPTKIEYLVQMKMLESNFWPKGGVDQAINYNNLRTDLAKMIEQSTLNLIQELKSCLIFDNSIRILNPKKCKKFGFSPFYSQSTIFKRHGNHNVSMGPGIITRGNEGDYHPWFTGYL